MTIPIIVNDDERDSLPDMLQSKEFNSKYNIYEVLGKLDVNIYIFK